VLAVDVVGGIRGERVQPGGQVVGRRLEIRRRAVLVHLDAAHDQHLVAEHLAGVDAQDVAGLEARPDVVAREVDQQDPGA
jgi:hypothetical protein